jgi:hypothetical protein
VRERNSACEGVPVRLTEALGFSAALLDFGPRIFQSDRAIEDELAVARVRISTASLNTTVN